MSLTVEITVNFECAKRQIKLMHIALTVCANRQINTHMSKQLYRKKIKVAKEK